MGIRFLCPNGHKLHVKAYLAGRRGICPDCGVKFDIPAEDTGQVRPANQAEVDAESQGAPRHAQTDAALHAGEATSIETVAASAVATPVPTAAPAGSAGVRPDDVLAAAPDAVWYVRPRSGGQYGPAASPVMRQWIDEGRVPPDALVWRDGWRDWREASAVFGTGQKGSDAPEADSGLHLLLDDESSASSAVALGARRKKVDHSARNMVLALVAGVVVLGAVLAVILSR